MMAGKYDPGISRALMDFSFWEEAWQKASEAALRSRRREGLQAQEEFWNKRAEEFAGKVIPDQDRVEEILSWLATQGVLWEGISILDVGSGPGAFALPFAARGARVVALEPAGAMISAMKENMAGKELPGRVQVVKEFWETADIRGRGWEGEFDLVFSSMSPGINNWETIEKTLKCSKRYCYYSGFAGERFSRHHRTLWEILFDEKMPPWPADIFYINQLLVLKGFDTIFHVWNRRRYKTLKPQEAVESFLGFFRQYGREIPSMKENILSYVESRLEEGVFRHEINTRLGKVLVKV